MLNNLPYKRIISQKCEHFDFSGFSKVCTWHIHYNQFPDKPSVFGYKLDKNKSSLDWCTAGEDGVFV